MSQLVLFAPRRFADNRGWFRESYNAKREISNGIECTFVQDNHSFSADAGTIRGIHFQRPPYAQAKLVQCIRGSIKDFAVDIRNGSPTYGQYIGVDLSERNGRNLFVPIGFGHAFITLEPNTEVMYKVSDFYDPAHDGGIRWDCPEIAIAWPSNATGVTLSAKDAVLPTLSEFESPFPYGGIPLELVTIA